MAMRLQELHPALVHYPLALVPAAIGTDLVGYLTDNHDLEEVGRHAMPIAAASAAVAALAGLAAQEEVRAEGEAREMLVTHRNLNATLVTATALMAVWRAQRPRASAGYFALGLAGLATMAYTAYLGGRMVYEHGVGVTAAQGLRLGPVPELRPGQMGEATRTIARDVARAIPHAVEDVRRGEIAPYAARQAGRDREDSAGAPPE